MMPFVPHFGPQQPQEEKPKPKPKPPVPVLTEAENLVAHRVLGLLDLGFTLEQTMELCDRADIVHDSDALLKRGWPHAFVYEELT